MNIKTILIDDEPYALSRIKRLVEGDQAFEVIGEVSGVKEGIELVKERKPELLFLDIKMPDGTGFDILSELDEAQRPYVIFVTAYDHYAIKAFEYDAIDYLLKPFDNSRFYRIAEKAKKYINLKRNSAVHQQIVELMSNGHQPKMSTPDQDLQIKIVERGWDIFIDIQDVVLFESSGNYCKVHTAKRFYMYKKTMKELEAELTDTQFMRVHRSFIVNLGHVEDVIYLGKNEYQFSLSNSVQLTSGRSYASNIKTLKARINQ